MRRRSFRKALCSLLLYVSILLPQTRSQRPDYIPAKWQENKFWWWSSDAPMTKALDGIPDVLNGKKMILDHWERVEQRIVSGVGTTLPPGVNLIKPCNSRDLRDWPRAVRSNFGIRGFPDPDLSCVTDFTGVQFTLDEIPPYTDDQIYEATLRQGLAIQTNAKSIASRLGLANNFTGASYMFNYPYGTPTAACVMHPVHGVRVDGRWRKATPIHNRPRDEALPQLGRKIVVEYHRVVDGDLTDNLLMRVPEYPKDGTERVFREDTTTIFINARGVSNPSMFRAIPIWENPAIIESLDKAGPFIEQAEDAVTTSNIAILVLPLSLNVVPVAILSKGIELIQIQQRLHRSVVTRISSSLNSTRSEAAAAEMWVAECQARENVRTVGVVFVSLAVAFLVGGTLLEIAARSYLQRRNRCRLEQKLMSDVPGAGVMLELLDSKSDPVELSGSSLSQSHMYSREFYLQESEQDSSDISSASRSGHHHMKPWHKAFR